jgi:beta-lactamase regulating signal transducer with metallopeptidase domain
MTALDGPLTDAVGLAVLHLLWQGAIIAAVLAVTLKLLANSTASVRYAISCAALAAFVMFGVATGYRAYEPAIAPAGGSIVAVEDEGSAAEAGGATQRTPPPASVLDVVQEHSSSIALVWLLGVVALATKLTVSWNRARALTSSGVNAAPSEHQLMIQRLSERLGIGRSVALLESLAVEVPSVVGFLKPVILVPAASLSGLSPRQLELILAHELAHIRRHDFLVNMLQSVAETLLFYHPAAWWVSKQIRIERENCCDDLAVAVCGNALEYARALTLLEELRSPSSVAVAASGGSLLGRVKRLVLRGDGRSVNGWTAVAAAISFAVVLTITSLPVHAGRDQAPAPPPAPPAPEIEVLAPEPPELDALEMERPPRPPRPPRARVAVVPRVAVAPAALADAITDGVEEAVEAIEVDVDVDLDDVDLEDLDDEEEAPRADGRLTINELIALRIHGVSPQYISEMRTIFGNIGIKEVTSLKMMDVSPKYVSDMRAAGVEIKTAKEAVALKAQNVTVDFVRSLAAAGYSKLTVRDLTRLAAAGVNADFIREMQKYRSDK